MAQSDVECANIALTKLGAAKITTLSDTTETAIAANLCLGPLKKALLRAHPWNFAIKRKRLTPTRVDLTNVTEDGATGWFKLWTASTSGLSSGDGVTIEDVVGCEAANGTWVCDSVVDGTSFLLSGVDFAGSYTSGGTWTEAGVYDYSFSIALPSDLLRLVEVSELPDHRVEGGRILVNDDEVFIKYVYDVTDYTAMDAAFYDLLAQGLAAQICYKITQSSTKEAELKDEFRVMRGKFRHIDATEDPAGMIEADDWINARGGSWSGKRLPSY